MNAGRLNRRCVLQQHGTTQDALGQPVSAWNDVGSVWASIIMKNGLSATGELPATHYISAGSVGTELVGLLEDPEALSAAAGITLEQAQGILGACVVDERLHDEVLTEMGLMVCAEVEG